VTTKQENSGELTPAQAEVVRKALSLASLVEEKTITKVNNKNNGNKQQ
jgi:hypothetical protein